MGIFNFICCINSLYYHVYIYIFKKVNKYDFLNNNSTTCSTYKAGDSKAQAFSFWLKEYIYNALIQPVHLLLYTVLVTSALSLAATNMLYAIVALAFILPAEKILKQMFNFRNTTGQSLGGFAGGMITKGILDTVARGGKRVAANATNKIRTANNLGIKDPDAPKGASALAGAASLVAGAPAVAQAVQGMAWNANNNGGQANSGMGILGALSGSAQGAAGGDRRPTKWLLAGEGGLPPLSAEHLHQEEVPGAHRRLSL